MDPKTSRDLAFYVAVLVAIVALGAYLAMVVHLGHLATQGPVIGIAADFFGRPLILLFFVVICVAFEQKRWIAGSVLLLLATLAATGVLSGWVYGLGTRLA